MNKQERIQLIINKETERRNRRNDIEFTKRQGTIHLKEGDVLEQNNHYYDVKRLKNGYLVMSLITDEERLEQLENEKVEFDIDMANDIAMNAGGL